MPLLGRGVGSRPLITQMAQALLRTFTSYGHCCMQQPGADHADQRPALGVYLCNPRLLPSYVGKPEAT